MLREQQRQLSREKARSGGPARREWSLAERLVNHRVLSWAKFGRFRLLDALVRRVDADRPEIALNLVGNVRHTVLADA